MGKASRTKVDVSRREKIAAQREAQRRAERRRRMLIAAGSIVVVVAIVLTFVIIKLNGKPASAGSASNGPTGAALAAVVAKTTTVPASVLDAVGDGGGAVTGKPAAISSGSALTANGKPEMLYIGAEYCPYCAAERWAMIVALSRFGTFSGLSTVHSSSIDVYANTPTFTFYKSAYTSPYLAFAPVETTTNVPDSGSTSGYVPLQTPTSAQTALWYKYTSSGTIPFIDFGGKAFISGVSYSNQVLAGLSWSQIAADLSNPNSPVAKAIDGTANYMTAAICQMTGNQPASACTSTVQSLESQV